MTHKHTLNSQIHINTNACAFWLSCVELIQRSRAEILWKTRLLLKICLFTDYWYSLLHEKAIA